MPFALPGNLSRARRPRVAALPPSGAMDVGILSPPRLTTCVRICNGSTCIVHNTVGHDR